MDKAPKIQLTRKQLSNTHDWVQQQQELKWDTNTPDKWFDKKQTSYNVALLGKLGEVAAQTIFGGTIDWDIHTRGDTGSDLQLPHHSATVKTNTYQGDHRQVHLIINTLDEFVTDAAILVHLQGDKHDPLNPDNIWEICGIISKAKYLKHHKTQNYGHGTRTYITKRFLTLPHTYKAMHP